MPFKINDDGTFTLTGVDHTGMTDTTANIQSAINSIFDNYGGGYLWLPRPGNYQSNGLIMKGSVTLRGHGSRNTLLGSVANQRQPDHIRHQRSARRLARSIHCRASERHVDFQCCHGAGQCSRHHP